MAKQSKMPPLRRQRDDESLLIRSAESLGRIIGSLHRQLDGAGQRSSKSASRGAGSSYDGRDNGRHHNGPHHNEHRPARPTADARAAGEAPKVPVSAQKTRSESGASKVRSTVDRTSKRAAKSAAAKKTTAGRSAAKKAARRSSRG